MRFSPFTPSELKVVPSRLYLGLSCFVTLGSSLCIIGLALPFWLQGAALLGVACSVGWCLRRQGWWPRRAVLFTLRFDEQGWNLLEQGRGLRLPRIEAVKLTGWVLFLKARMPSGRTRHLSLWRDSLDEGSFHAMYVAMKFNAFETDQNIGTTVAPAGALSRLRQKLSGIRIVSLISGARSG